MTYIINHLLQCRGPVETHPSSPHPFTLPPGPLVLGLNIAQRKPNPQLWYDSLICEWKSYHRDINPQAYVFGVNADLVFTSVSTFSSGP